MSAKKFKFVSPGVFLNEIDNSILPREPREIGPLIIGRAERGPVNRPVTVDSFEEFVNLYGTPVPGGNGEDVWRNGNKLTPMYGTYAAQAWLKNSPTLTYFRLGGTQHINNDGTNSALAGFRTEYLLNYNEQTADWSNFHTEATGSATGSTAAGGGAYGLFVFDSHLSGSTVHASANGAIATTGSLAAIWYINEGSIGLSGVSAIVSASATSGMRTVNFSQAELVASDANGTFTAKITGSGGLSEVVSFNFDKNNDRFIRKVFNTNPTLVNSTITTTNSSKNYWLGETFENTIQNFNVLSVHNAPHNYPEDNTNKYWGTIAYIGGAAPHTATSVSLHHGRKQRAFTDPETGWFFSQDLTSATGSFDPRNQQKLFKLISLGHGEWAQKNLKISIQNIKEPANDFNKYPSFDVVIRNIADNDRSQVVLEKFSNCNLNPKSSDFIGFKIGTQYFQFNTAKRRLELRGTFPNKSKYVYVSLDAAVEGGTANEEFVPFGVYGPPKYRDIHVEQITIGSSSQPAKQSLKMIYTSSAEGLEYKGNLEAVGALPDRQNTVFAVAGDLGLANDAAAGLKSLEAFDVGGGHDSITYITSSLYNIQYRMNFPKVQLRQHTDQDNLSSPDQANFGVWTGESTNSTIFNREILDLVRAPTSDITEIHDPSTTSKLEHQYIFTLDDVYYDSDAKRYAYAAGKRRGDQATNNPSFVSAGTSVTAVSGSWKNLIATGVKSFTTLMHGGFDGFDVTEKNPLRNTLHDGGTETTSYEFNTIKQAIDSVKDPEFAEYNLISVPGITNESLTRHLIDTVEDRSDALAVIDLKGDFAPIHEAQAASYGSVSTVTTNLKNRSLNSSYACAYYPYVTVRDTLTGDLVYMPPSVLAIGAMSFTDRTKAPWFAPAGFNRGGLSSGIAGLPVISVTDKLNSEDRDDLYEANINPIASFPSEGIVIFGQKTLQVTRSALDRINVRRLLLFVKKGISRISNELLFEPNVQETWDRFISRANPFLSDVKARFGLTDYKLVLDKTTTTPDLIDQNILYAKVFLKPARAIEFIAVDFIITNTGASFED